VPPLESRAATADAGSPPQDPISAVGNGRRSSPPRGGRPTATADEACGSGGNNGREGALQ
jgi:hypothetical protein